MRTDDPKTIHLKNYVPFPFHVDTVDLHFVLDAAATRVSARLALRRREGATGPLRRDGHDLTLKRVAIDGTDLTADAYTLDDTSLTLAQVPDRFTLETEVEIAPDANTALEGLYMSGGKFCTQCEAEGFRRITFFPDRPDVMSVYTVRLEADKAAFPVLLSNGNPGTAGDLEGGRHFSEWHDPHPKPAYLFALVAGDLGHIEDHFTTRSGKSVLLRIYTEHGNEAQCTYAMDSLKRSMSWDETAFDREYDLEVFNIVAVGDFNAGAMENKGLNIFNAALVLASPETATDLDYERIEAVVAHEYFHNWTGNRITCRDWFQLCLKEGLTVYRDQRFTADMRDATVKRIDDANRLRTVQFPEDAGGLAHPVRPDHYIKIDNFYTATVYEKGAELVHMIDTLIGREAFEAGMAHYFADHDNTAATVEDFVTSFEKASKRDLAPFLRWYAQAGTPRVTARGVYAPEAQTFTLHLTQTTPATPDQPTKEPVPIPVRMGLVGTSGRALALQLDGENDADRPSERVLELTQAQQSFTFVNVPERPVPSLLRHFSAPVVLDTDLSVDDRVHLIAHDEDPFTKWDAANGLALGELAAQARGEAPSPAQEALIHAVGACLDSHDLKPAFLARLITPPREDEVAQTLDEVDPGRISAARQTFRQAMAAGLKERLSARLAAHDRAQPFSPDADQAGARALANAALSLLSSLEDPQITAQAVSLATSAGNMTDQLAGLSVLADLDHPEREAILDRFYETWTDNPLVIDKWFALQARADRLDTVERVRALSEHSAYTLRNPNRVRALVGAFVAGNPKWFHEADGAGYAFFADQILAVDALNPLFAARLFGVVKTWRKLEPTRRALIAQSFERIAAAKPISDNLYEVVSRTLKG